MNNYSQLPNEMAGMSPQVAPQSQMMTGSEMQPNTGSGTTMMPVPSGFDPNLMMQMMHQMINMGMMGNISQMGNNSSMGMNQHFSNLGMNEQQAGYMGMNQQQLGNSAGFSDTSMNPMSVNTMGFNNMGLDQMPPNSIGFNNMGMNQTPSNSMGFDNMGMNQMPSNSVGFDSAGMNQMPFNSMGFCSSAMVSQTAGPAANMMQSTGAGCMQNSQVSGSQGNFPSSQEMMPGNTFGTNNISTGSMDYSPRNFVNNRPLASVRVNPTRKQPMGPVGQPQSFFGQPVRSAGPSSMNLRRPIRPVGPRPMRALRPFRPRPPGIPPLLRASTQPAPLSRMQHAPPTISVSNESENVGGLAANLNNTLTDFQHDVPADETYQSPAKATKKRKLNKWRLKTLPISVTMTPGENVIPPPPGTEAELNNEDFVSETKVDGPGPPATVEGTGNQGAIGVEEFDQEGVRKKRKKKDSNETAAENTDSLFCPVCNVKCNTQQNFAQHMQGNKHKAKLAEVSEKCAKMAQELKEKAQAGDSSDRADATSSSSTIQVSIKNENAASETFPKGPLFCKVCQVQFTEPLLEHRRSAEHKQKKKEQRPYCRQCNMWFNSPKKFVEHSNTERHKINYDDWLRRQKASGFTSTDVDDYIEEFPENMDDFIVVDATGIYSNETIDSPTPAVQTYPVISEFDRNIPVGQEFVIPVSGYFCKICHKFYNNEYSGKVVHCQSKSHYDKFKEKMSKTTEKNAVELTTESKNVSKDPVDKPARSTLTESVDVAKEHLPSSGVDTPKEITAKMTNKLSNVLQTTVTEVKGESMCNIEEDKQSKSAKFCAGLVEQSSESEETSTNPIDKSSALTLTETAVMPADVANQQLTLSNADTPHEANTEMTSMVQPTVCEMKTESSCDVETMREMSKSTRENVLEPTIEQLENVYEEPTDKCATPIDKPSTSALANSAEVVNEQMPSSSVDTPHETNKEVTSKLQSTVFEVKAESSCNVETISKMSEPTKKNAVEPTIEFERVYEDPIDKPSTPALTNSAEVVNEQMPSSSVDTPHAANTQMTNKVQPTVSEVKTERACSVETEHVNENELAKKDTEDTDK